MKIKSTLILLVLFLSVGFNYAQKVKIKKGIVYLDDVAILKSDYRKTTHSLYDLQGNEIIFMQFSNNSPGVNFQYLVFKFLEQRVTIESSDIDYMSLSYNTSIEKIIKWLLKEKVLTKDGKINPEKLYVFQFKYDESISKRYRCSITTECEHKDSQKTN